MKKDISIKVCMGTGGIAAGGVAVMSTFEQALANAGLRATVEKNCPSCGWTNAAVGTLLGGGSALRTMTVTVALPVCSPSLAVSVST